jgi:hypothetical protein
MKPDVLYLYELKEALASEAHVHSQLYLCIETGKNMKPWG